MARSRNGRARSQAEEGPEQSAGAMAARRRLGRVLKDLREARDITTEEAADAIERSRPWLWKLETGLSGISIKPQTDVGRLCDLYRADDETRQGLLGLVEATKIKGWYQPFSDLLPPQFDIYLGLEEIAAELNWYESELVPGLLQTAEYAETMIRAVGDNDERAIERLVTLRIRRQRLLTRKRPIAPRVNVVLSEAVLRRSVGGVTTMANQLGHINELGELPNVSVRVVPYNAGAYRGLAAGPFVVMKFPGEDDPPMVYVDGFTGVLLIKDEKPVTKFEGAFTNTWKAALDEGTSRDFIAKAAKELARA